MLSSDGRAIASSSAPGRQSLNEAGRLGRLRLSLHGRESVLHRASLAAKHGVFFEVAADVQKTMVT